MKPAHPDLSEMTVELWRDAHYMARMRTKHPKHAGFLATIKATLWPKRGINRPVRYYAYRILRLRASPHNIAAGVAAGVGSSFTPFVGVHFFLSFGLAWLLRGSLIASALGTVLAGNPITWPFIWAGTWEIGNLMLGQNVMASGSGPDLHAIFAGFSFLNLGSLILKLWRPVFEPMLLGSIPLGLFFGFGSYFLTLYGATVFQKRRKERMEARARSLSLSEIDPTDIR